MSKILPEFLDFWETPYGRGCITKTRKRLFGGRKYDLLIQVGDGWYTEKTITNKELAEPAYEYIGHWDIKNLFKVRTTDEQCPDEWESLMRKDSNV